MKVLIFWYPIIFFLRTTSLSYNICLCFSENNHARFIFMKTEQSDHKKNFIHITEEIEIEKWSNIGSKKIITEPQPKISCSYLKRV